MMKLADSWVKVYQRNLLEYTSKILTEEELKIKHDNYRNLIEKSVPVMKDINEVLSGISRSYVVALFDEEGDIIELMEKKNATIKMGHRCHEMNGTISALGIAIRTGQLAKTIAVLFQKILFIVNSSVTMRDLSPEHRKGVNQGSLNLQMGELSSLMR